jgi:hypothetical protein
MDLRDATADVAHQRREMFGRLQPVVEHRPQFERGRMQVAGERLIVHRHQLTQFGLESLRVLQVLHAQRPPRHLVFVGRPDTLSRGADLAAAGRFTQRLAGAVQRHVERQDQRARLADQQARAHIQPHRFEASDFDEQVRGVDHHAVADQAGHAFAHDTRWNQLQRGLDSFDHQRMSGVVAALEAHHRLCVIGQPVDDLALAFVAPLGADHHHVAPSCD